MFRLLDKFVDAVLPAEILNDLEKIPLTREHKNEVVGEEEYEESYSYEFSEDDDGGNVKRYGDDDEDEDSEIGNALDTLKKDLKELYAHQIEDKKLLRYVFNLFREHARPVCVDGIEYLCPDRKDIIINHASFRHLSYSELPREQFRLTLNAKALPNIQDTYLVNKRLDFIYGRLIELALLSSEENENFANNAKQLFKTRRSNLHPCREQHVLNEKVCPLEWIIYTRINSEFYKFCSQQLKENPYIAHGITTEYIGIENLSFYLVIFLCGDFLDYAKVPSRESTSMLTTTTTSTTTTTAAAADVTINMNNNNSYALNHYQEVNQWRKVPAWFLDLWLIREQYINKI
jgi:hypothetical protein